MRGTRQDWYAGDFGNFTRGGFVAHLGQNIRRRSDKNNASIAARLRKAGVFAEKTVARMDAPHALGLGQRDDAGNVEVSGDGAFALADKVGLVRLEAVHAETVFLGVNGYGAVAEFRGAAKDAHGDFTAIGNEDFFRGGHGRVKALVRSKVRAVSQWSRPMRLRYSTLTARPSILRVSCARGPPLIFCEKFIPHYFQRGRKQS